MDLSDYYLLKLIDRLGELRGRKRLQKLVYLLRLEGFSDTYFMHYFGPYSADLAERVDFLREIKMLEEKVADVGVREYHYVVTAGGEAYIKDIEEGLGANDTRDRFEARYVATLDKLKNHSVWELELAATMVYWIKWGEDWQRAKELTMRKKNAREDSDAFRNSEALAEEVLGAA